MSDQAPQAEPSFEQALAELEAIVDQLERGDLSLEQALDSFERGVALTALCQRALSAAEQRVEILTGKDEDTRLEPFDSAE
jgi:exodeoxyribonuclease VII small subunit